MRNLNDIEAKAILLLNTIEAAIVSGQQVPFEIVLASSNVRASIAAEDKRLGADLNKMYNDFKKASGDNDTN